MYLLRISIVVLFGIIGSTCKNHANHDQKNTKSNYHKWQDSLVKWASKHVWELSSIKWGCIHLNEKKITKIPDSLIHIDSFSANCFCLSIQSNDSVDCRNLIRSGNNMRLLDNRLKVTIVNKSTLEYIFYPSIDESRTSESYETREGLFGLDELLSKGLMLKQSHADCNNLQ